MMMSQPPIEHLVNKTFVPSHTTTPRHTQPGLKKGRRIINTNSGQPSKPLCSSLVRRGMHNCSVSGMKLRSCRYSWRNTSDPRRVNSSAYRGGAANWQFSIEVTSRRPKGQKETFHLNSKACAENYVIRARARVLFGA